MRPASDSNSQSQFNPAGAGYSGSWATAALTRLIHNSIHNSEIDGL
jgi:hypothetical protein